MKPIIPYLLYFSFVVGVVCSGYAEISIETNTRHDKLFSEGKPYSEEIHRLSREYKSKHGKWGASLSALLERKTEGKEETEFDWSRCRNFKFNVSTNGALVVKYTFQASWGSYPQTITIADRAAPSRKVSGSNSEVDWLNMQLEKSRKKLNMAKLALAEEKAKPTPDQNTVIKHKRQIDAEETVLESITERIARAEQKKPPSASSEGDIPSEWHEGTMILKDGRTAAGAIGLKPLSQQYVVKKNDTMISVPKEKVDRIVIDFSDYDQRRDPWELDGSF